MTKTILVVDDDPAQRRLLQAAVERSGYATKTASDGPSALAQADTIDLMLLDLVMPGMTGMDVLADIRVRRPELPVIVLTASGGVDTVVKAMQAGAADFFVKPASPERIVVSIRNALETSNLKAEVTRLKKKAVNALGFEDMVADAPSMRPVVRMGQRAATANIPVLILGESGVGKEVLARAIQSASERAGRAFITVNCGAIPETLVESILFGHVKGAFTGATDNHAGKFVEANGGTLFLDEVGDMPLPMQAKLLRALQERTVQRLGGSTQLPVDVRVLAATNQDLEQMVAAKTFREDLYYRLHVVRIHLPALRERSDDVPLLAQHFLAAATARNGLPPRKLANATLGWLTAQPWPGNVRQLRNVLEGAAVLAEGPEVSVQDLQAVATPVPARGDSGQTDWFGFARIEDFRAATEKEFLRRKLLEFGGNIKRTAENIDLQRSNLYKKLERYGLK